MRLEESHLIDDLSHERLMLLLLPGFHDSDNDGIDDMLSLDSHLSVNFFLSLISLVEIFLLVSSLWNQIRLSDFALEPWVDNNSFVWLADLDLWLVFKKNLRFWVEELSNLKLQLLARKVSLCLDLIISQLLI